MIFSLFFVLVFAGVLGFYVLSPLMQSSEEALGEGAIESESDLRGLLDFRDALVAKLCQKEIPHTQAHSKVVELENPEALEALVRVCQILKKAGMPYLPSLLALFSLATATEFLNFASQSRHVSFFAEQAMAQPLAQPLDTPSDESIEDSQTQESESPGQSSMPGLAPSTDGTVMSKIHQFVLSPDQGRLRVFYLALFNSEPSGPGAPETNKSVQLRIPSPSEATDFDFSNMTEATLVPDRADEPPVLSIPVRAGMNQIQGMFTIPAATGTLKWNSSFFKNLPGVVLIILPEYHDAITAVFGEAFAGINLWPPRMSIPPAGFELKRTREQPNEKDPNFSRMKTPPDQFSYQYFRRGDDNAPYPSFELKGLAPSRTPFLVLITTFGFILFGIALYATFLARGKPNEKAL